MKPWFIIRYLIAALLAFGGFYLFYLIFTPLTILPCYFILSLFFHTKLQESTIFLPFMSLEFVSACIAGAAYYLLTALNLTTPMKLKTRLLFLAYTYLAFLVINIIRIILLVFAYSNFNSIFDSLHILFWHALSIIFVLLIWFSAVKLFRVTTIPVYSDVKALLKSVKKKK